jgi:anti-anti-sigma factor
MAEWHDGAPPAVAPAVDVDVSRTDAAATVYLTGELDLAADDCVTMVIEGLLADRSVREIIVDLAGVSFCDSTGIALLIKAWQIGQAIGTTVRITADAQPRVAAVLQLTGVWEVLCNQPPPATRQT